MCLSCSYYGEITIVHLYVLCKRTANVFNMFTPDLCRFTLGNVGSQLTEVDEAGLGKGVLFHTQFQYITFMCLTVSLFLALTTTVI